MDIAQKLARQRAAGSFTLDGSTTAALAAHAIPANAEHSRPASAAHPHNALIVAFPIGTSSLAEPWVCAR